MIRKYIDNRYFFYITVSFLFALLMWLSEGLEQDDTMFFFKNRIDYLFGCWSLSYLFAFVVYEVREKKRRKKENK